MKIAIIGAGAMGTLFAGLLAKSGNQISILTNNTKTEKRINKNGLTITGLSKFHIPPSKILITANPHKIKESNLIIILVKSYDTVSVISSIKNMMNNNTHILTLQNGIGNYENIIKSVNKSKVIVGSTSQSAEFLDYGKIKHTGKGETIIGNTNSAVSKKIIEVFKRCGIKTVLVGKMDSVIWSKLVLNCAINPVTAISGVKNGELIRYNNLKEVAIEAGKEVIKVADELGIKLLYSDITKKIEDTCKATAQNINSMLVDIKRNRKTEIENMNGAVIRIARKHNLPMYVNKCLYQIIGEIVK
ncbi:MAG: hypothetical protein A2474_03280 [Elusimicrobia bacterium RIFOXYC2_FULL_34_12]|nr:MAG: hypothetical protein A2474_03280 [Elusimicrobia bacterium RIFOXYC2_FULL_34_12]OGS37900.1 MAG: hypothetical protein A2551_01655 [Elusimicrobia bacterium RIFOXYD2_FULL_34_30]HAM39105.1 hypothetical protein [Elusimicrobiota bacterium]